MVLLLQLLAVLVVSWSVDAAAESPETGQTDDQAIEETVGKAVEEQLEKTGSSTIPELRALVEAQQQALDEQRQLVEAQQQALDEQRQLIEAQQRELDEHQQQLESGAEQSATEDRRLDAQEAQLEEQEAERQANAKRLAELEELFLSVHNRLEVMETASGADSVSEALAKRLAELEASVEEIPEVPTDVISAGDFPGSMRVPGTDAAIKIGGRVRFSLVRNLDALGVDDRFLTAAIPIAGTPEAGKGPRLSMSAAASRFNFDVRTPTPVGQMRAFIEGDFANQESYFRLRHAYVQYSRLLFGQTWSTFVDLDADPEDIDFEGINGRTLLRQTQIRWTSPLRDSFAWAVAIEDPFADITGGSSVSQVPSVVGRVKVMFPTGHLQSSIIIRDIRGEMFGLEGEIASTTGWGATLSGNIGVPGSQGELSDNCKFQLIVGDGIGRYVNDLESLGGQDAVFDSTNADLQTLPVVGGYGSYQHHWQNNLHSTVLFALVDVNNLGIQDADSYKRTYRASINVIYTPFGRLNAGVEFLWGRRIDKDREKGDARQIQVAGTFSF